LFKMSGSILTPTKVLAISVTPLNDCYHSISAYGVSDCYQMSYL
jgi:hypothetical protein